MRSMSILALTLAALVLPSCSGSSYQTKFSAWKAAGECIADPSQCSNNMASCCGKVKGKQLFVRSCLTESCHPGYLTEKWRNCKVKCQAGFGPWQVASECQRPSNGECSAQGSCCNEWKGKRTLSRSCLSDMCHQSVQTSKQGSCHLMCDRDLPTDWTNWVSSGCSASCGEGTSTWKRQRVGDCYGLQDSNTITKQEQTRKCNVGACAEWTPWSSSECSATCGKGSITYTRTCEGLGECEGSATKDSTDCNLGPCANWTPWSSSECSATCGNGVITYSRTCVGLGDCEGSATKDSTECNPGPCANWSEWNCGECSATCDEGVIECTRTCEGLGECDGSATKTMSCGELPSCVTCPAQEPTYLSSVVCRSDNGEGTIVTGPFQPDTRCTFSCAEGYKIKHKINRTNTTCLDDGTWDKDPPCCVPAQCDRHTELDVVVLIDTSTSINIPIVNWPKQQAFMKDILQNMTIAMDEIRVGYIPFSGQPRVDDRVLLSETTNKDDLFTKIDDLSCCIQGTGTGAALGYTADVMFTRENGDRRRANNLAIVITDGLPREEDETLVPVNAARLRTKAAVFAIGIGLKEGGVEVMEQIAGDPENFIIAESFDVLAETATKIEKMIKKTGCNQCVPPPPPAEWTPWSSSECSSTCGKGSITYTRTCEGLGECEGSATKDSTECNKGPCAEWTPWSSSECSATCGKGSITYTRTCKGLGECEGSATKDSTECNKGPCASWSEWNCGECSATCDEGVIECTRTCEGLGECDGSATKTMPCEGLPRCVTCPAQEPTYLSSVVCRSNNGEGVIVTGPFQPDTRCTFSCAEGYKIKHRRNRTNNTCLDDGTWDKEAPCCVPEQCDRHTLLDVVVVIDTSTSINIPTVNWHKQQAFMKDILQNMTIAMDEVRVGYIPFSGEPRVDDRVLLSETTNKDDLFTSIDDLSCCIRGTGTGAALGYTADVMFTRENGDRRQANNLAIIITDGLPREEDETLVPVNAARLRNKAAVFAIGIGLKEGGVEVMEQIAGPGQEDNFIIAESFDVLAETATKIEDMIKKTGCNQCVPPPPPAEWTPWSSSECSSTCGKGSITYTRTCEGLGECEGSATKDSTECNLGPCAQWTMWSSSECSATCGKGSITYTRTCEGLGECEGSATKDSTECNKGPCANWSEWNCGECSATCDEGVIECTRTCEGLGECDGSATKTMPCEGLPGCITCPVQVPTYLSSVVCRSDNGEGAVVTGPFQPDTQCTFSCAEGYKIKHRKSRTNTYCQDDGTWDKEAPCCVPTQCDSHTLLDVVVLIDTSTSINIPIVNWPKQQAFMKDILQNMTIAMDEIRVGYIPFSGEPRVDDRVLLSETTNKDDLFTNIDDLSCCIRGTGTGAALGYTADVMFTRENGDRKKANNLAIVITDGLPREEDETLVPVNAARLRNKAAVFAIGIGLKEGGVEVMEQIAGDPENFIIAESFDVLAETATKIEDMIKKTGCNQCVPDPEA